MSKKYKRVRTHTPAWLDSLIAILEFTGLLVGALAGIYGFIVFAFDTVDQTTLLLAGGAIVWLAIFIKLLFEQNTAATWIFLGITVIGAGLALI